VTPRQKLVKLLHVLASTNISAGGPPQAVRDITTALARQGIDITVVATTDVQREAVEFDRRVRVRVCRTLFNDSLGLSLAPRFPSVLRAEMSSADMVHVHELWHFPQALGSLYCNLKEIPYVVSPHGELSDWSLDERRALKQAAWLTYQKRVLSKAGGIHALTEEEAAALAAKGLSANVHVIPNGIDIARIQTTLSSSDSNLTKSSLPERFILYVGRLHHKKGVFFLLNVFARLAREFLDLELLIAGPDPQGMWEKLSLEAHELGLSSRVRYLGVLEESSKLRLIELSQLIVLPSFSEGMSMVLLEALACATPVVISPNCGVPEVQSSGAGKVVPLDVNSFSEAIREVVNNPDRRDAMSRQAFALAVEKFQSTRVAARMIKFYAEVLER